MATIAVDFLKEMPLGSRKTPLFFSRQQPFPLELRLINSTPTAMDTNQGVIQGAILQRKHKFEY